MDLFGRVRDFPDGSALRPFRTRVEVHSKSRGLGDRAIGANLGASLGFSSLARSLHLHATDLGRVRRWSVHTDRAGNPLRSGILQTKNIRDRFETTYRFDPLE